MSLIFIVALLVLVITTVIVTVVFFKKKKIVPVIIFILVVLFGYLGFSSPFCQTKSSFFKDDPIVATALAKQQTVGNFVWNAPRWKVDGDRVTSCNAMYEVLMLGIFGR